MRALIWQLKPVGLEQGLIHALHYYSKMLGLDLKVTTDEQAQRAFKTIEETSQNAVNEMRALIWQLKPVGLEQGLIHALHYYSKMLGLDLKVTINGLIDLSNDIEENVYRIIQEAMNNVIKHAKTNKVYLDLSQNVDYLEVDIRDNGQGFDTQSINTFYLMV